MSFVNWLANRFFARGSKPSTADIEQSPFRGSIKMQGMFNAYLRGSDGELKEEWHIPNIITSGGEAHVADQMSDQGQGAMSHMAVGTSGTGPATGNTALGGELDRNALTATQDGGGIGKNKVRYECNWAAGDGTGAIQEAGIFNAATAGTMFARVCFSVINKGAADTLDVDWDVTFSDDGV